MLVNDCNILEEENEELTLLLIYKEKDLTDEIIKNLEKMTIKGLLTVDNFVKDVILK